MSQLLPNYYTTTNTRKRKASKKSKSLIEAERIHEKFLNKHLCGKSGRVNDANVTLYQRPSQVLTEGSTPSLSNTIPVGVAPKRIIHEHNFTIAPAYNKGAYQVISRRDIKDIGR
jgi:hypothetical protein